VVHYALQGLYIFFHWRYNPLWVCILQPSGGLEPPRVRGFLITHNDTPQSVELPWTSDQSVAATSNRVYNTYFIFNTTHLNPERPSI